MNAGTGIRTAVVRPVTPTDLEHVGALTARAYVSDGLLADDHVYADELRDATARARAATVLVAVEREELLGTVTIAEVGSGYAEVALEGEREIRMLAVDPAARGRGVGELLLRAALEHAAATGPGAVVLSTMPAMRAAQRMYERVGLVRVPGRDWDVEGHHMRVYSTAPSAPGLEVEVATWPPVRTQTVDGWRLGVSGGLTRRANSALPLADPADLPTTLSRVEAVYAAHGLPAVVRVGTAARPAGLDAALAARGYREAARTLVLVRALGSPPPGRVASGDREAAPSQPPVRVTAADEPDDTWIASWSAVKTGRPADPDLARQVLTGAPATYLTAHDGDRVVGVLRAARQGEWVGLSCVMVPESARRRGVARTLTEVALDRARADGATRAFLQVEEANTGARRLYERLGFALAETYTYRERETTR